MEDAQNGLLQFPQGFLGCYNIHLKRVFLAGCVLFQLLHSLNEGINNLILLQQDAIIMELNLIDSILHTLGKLPDMLVVKRIVRVLWEHGTCIV